jgi:hypothetical protein
VLRVTNSGIGQSECTGVRFLEIVTLPDFVLGAVPFFFLLFKICVQSDHRKRLSRGLEHQAAIGFFNFKR